MWAAATSISERRENPPLRTGPRPPARSRASTRRRRGAGRPPGAESPAPRRLRAAEASFLSPSSTTNSPRADGSRQPRTRPASPRYPPSSSSTAPRSQASSTAGAHTPGRARGSAAERGRRGPRGQASRRIADPPIPATISPPVASQRPSGADSIRHRASRSWSGSASTSLEQPASIDRRDLLSVQHKRNGLADSGHQVGVLLPMPS